MVFKNLKLSHNSIGRTIRNTFNIRLPVKLHSCLSQVFRFEEKSQGAGGGRNYTFGLRSQTNRQTQTERHGGNAAAVTLQRQNIKHGDSNQHEERENVHALQRDLDTEMFSWCAALFSCCTHMPKNHVWSDYDSDSETSKRKNSVFHNPSSGWTVRILCNRRGCFSFYELEAFFFLIICSHNEPLPETAPWLIQ